MADNKVDIAVGVDLKDFKTGMQQVDDAFNKATATVKKSANTTKTAFQATNKELKLTEEEIIAVTNQLKKWERELKSATDKKRIAELNSNIRETKKELHGVSSAAQDTGKKINVFADSAKSSFDRIGNAILTAFAFHVIKEFISSSIEAFKTQEEALIKLKDAYGGNEAGFRGMVAAAAEAQERLNIPDEVYESQAALLKSMGRTDAQIKKIIETANGMKVVLGTDLQGAVLQLNETFDGNLQRLGKYIKSGEKFTQTQLEQGAAVDILAEQYRGLGEEIAGTTIGRLEQLNVKWGDTKEGIGAATVEMLSLTGILPKLNSLLGELNKTFAPERLEDLLKFTEGFEKGAYNVAGALFGMGSLIGEEGVSGKAMELADTFEKSLIPILDKLRKGTDEQKQSFKDYMAYIKTLPAEVQAVFTIAIQNFQKTEEERRDIYKGLLTGAVSDTKDAISEVNKEQKKASEEWAKSNEELNKKLRALYIENTKDKHKQLLMQEADEVEAINKSLGNAKVKEDLKLQLAIKYGRLREAVDKESELRMQSVGERALEERKNLFNDELKYYETRSEEVRKGLSEEDQQTISIANFLGIELKEGDELNKLKDALNQAKELITNYVTEVLAQQVKLKEGVIANLDEQIAENQKAIEAEQKDAEEGRNNNLTALRQNEAKLKSEREKAVKELQKAKEREILINSAMEASNMILAISKLYKTLAGSVVGVALATALSAAMVAAFAASKNAAIKDAKQTKYAHGGTWVLNGASHQGGGIDLGNGKEAEGGERVAIFSRQATANNSGLASLVDAINRGELVINRDKMKGVMGNKNNIIVNIEGQKELTQIRDLISEQNTNKNGVKFTQVGKTFTYYRN